MQCDIEVPENLRATLAIFPPIFNNTLVSRSNIGDLIKKYAKEEKLLSQPRKMLISSFTLQNPCYFLQNTYYSSAVVASTTGACCFKKHRLVEYTPKKCFNSFVQAAVDARRKGDENPKSSVVSETMKLLANTSYGYQIMD